MYRQNMHIYIIMLDTLQDIRYKHSHDEKNLNKVKHECSQEQLNTLYYTRTQQTFKYGFKIILN